METSTLTTNDIYQGIRCYVESLAVYECGCGECNVDDLHERGAAILARDDAGTVDLADWRWIAERASEALDRHLLDCPDDEDDDERTETEHPGWRGGDHATAEGRDFVSAERRAEIKDLLQTGVDAGWVGSGQKAPDSA